MSQSRTARNARVAMLIILASLAGATPALSEEFVVFGPQDFFREDGLPEVVSASFSVPIPELAYRMLIYAGGLDGDQPVSPNTVVLLNGEQIAGPGDFRGQTSVVEKPVALAAVNSLQVVLAGPPGGVMTIEIRGDDSAVAYVVLEAVAPTSPNEPATVFNSGWPLELRLSLSRDPGLSVENGFSSEIGPFPRKDEWGFAVWEDPDGCLSWVDHVTPIEPVCPELQAMGPLPLDELLLQFRPSVRASGEFGASPDLPALVVLADTGTGWSDDGPVPVALNLAGLFNTVAYELNDWTRRTNILATMVVPFGLFAPVVEEDLCVGEPLSCDGSRLYRVRGFEGETISVAAGDERERCTIYESIYNGRVVTLRAFVVKLLPPLPPSDAPEGISMLEDVDGNGLVDSTDAALAGFELLSDELVVSFRQIFGALGRFDDSFSANFILPTDLDGNGRADGEVSDCGGPSASPVKLVKVPR